MPEIWSTSLLRNNASCKQKSWVSGANQQGKSSSNTGKLSKTRERFQEKQKLFQQVSCKVLQIHLLSTVGSHLKHKVLTFLGSIPYLLYLAVYFYTELLHLLEAHHVGTCNQTVSMYAVVRQEEYSRYAIFVFSCFKHRSLLYHPSLIIISTRYKIKLWLIESSALASLASHEHINLDIHNLDHRSQMI